MMVTINEITKLIESDYLNDDGFTLRFKDYMIAVASVWESEIYEDYIKDGMSEDLFMKSYGTEAYNILMMYRCEINNEEVYSDTLKYPEDL